MKRKLKIAALALTTIGFLSACGNNQTTEAKKDTDELSVVTTFYPVYEFTKNIVGDEGEVKLLIPAGTEAHDYEPSAKDVAGISEADVFVYHNENLETWVPQILTTFGEDAPNILKGTQDVILLPGDEEHEEEAENEDHQHALDPHTWLAPSLAIEEVTSISQQLMALYPEKKAVFEANTEKYLAELTALDAKYQSAFANPEQTNFVTQHAAFGYLAAEYGLKQIPIAGLSADQEPSPARIAELKDYVEANQIHYIYFEENANDKIAKTLASEVKVELVELSTLESLSKKEIDTGVNYISVMEENLLALQKTTNTTGKEIQPEDEDSEKTVANGYFEDQKVKDRALADYAGQWQSVYPLLKAGDLDQVFAYKAKINQDMTAEEYKAYYDQGYQTEVDELVITDKTIDFVIAGEHHKYTYDYQGYEILTYEKGNRGVRFTFKAQEEAASDFKYVQFSDHNIAPVKAEHFHIFVGGESQAALYEEMHNWPTYFPSDLSGQEVAQEMMSH
ncbi:MULTISPECIES: ZinT/AdcA family metal-binding protein [unclassified Enterococcus]|uniref:metal ABC transporter solute-binding protein, Zn/Mn family n=1 Tax=unclassified Enterococcus TaxID=2608891 RepID=UPI0024766C25|nr:MULTISPECIES: ZinT/AdcA family metal-binding protein [unclassified Enterococcus]